LSVGQRRGGRKSLASLTALSVLLSVAALVAPIAPASANHGTAYLDLIPETDTNPTGSTHTITAVLRDPNNNQPIAPGGTGVFVDFEIDGITDCAASSYTGETGGDAEQPCIDGDQEPPDNDDIRTTPDMTCSITPGSTVTGFPAGTACQVSYSRTDAGTDFIAGWVDEDNNNTTDESDPTETPGAGPDERNPGADPFTFTDPGAGPDEGDEEDPDDTDVVEKNWQAPAATFLDCDEQPANANNDLRGQNSTDNEVNQIGETETYRCVVFNQFGAQHDPGAQVAGETMTGVNDPPDPDDLNDPTPPDHPAQTCDPDCTFTISAEDDETGNQDICFFIVGSGEAGCAEAFGDPDFQAGPDPNAMDETNPGGTTAEARAADTVRKQWVSGTARSVDAEPDDDTNATLSPHTITARTFTQVGDPGQAGTTINFEWIQGPGDPNQTGPDAAPDATCVTDQPATNPGTNECSITYTSANAGIDVICVYTGTAPVFDPDPNPEQANCGNETFEQGEVVGNQDFEFQGSGQGGLTDVVIKRWVAQNQTPATTIDAAPNTDTNNTGQRHDIFVIARDAQGNPTFGEATAQQGTANCNQAAAGGATGGCPSRVRADILPGSPNASQVVVTEIQCARSGQQGIQTIGANQQPDAQNATHVCSYVGTNAGTDQIRVFYDANDNGLFDANEPNEIVQKTWSGQANQVTVTPQQDDAPVGACNPFTVTVTDVGGRGVATTIDVIQTFQNPPAAGQPGQPNITFCDPGQNAGQNVQATPSQQSPAGNAGSAPVGGGQPNTRRAEYQTNNNGQVTFGIFSDTPGTVNLTIFVETDDDETFEPQAGEPGTTATKTWTAGGQQAARNLDAEPETDQNPVNSEHRITATVTNQQGQTLPGVTVSMQFQQGSVNASPGSIQGCGVTDANGVAVCAYTGTNVGTDTIIVFANQGGAAGPDTGEPQDQVQKTWTPPPVGHTVDVTCTGTVAGGTARPGPTGETVQQRETREETCVNPTSDPDEVFTATVRNAQGQLASGIRVRFSAAINQQTTPQGGQGSLTDMTFTGGSGTGVNAVAECTTDVNGTCSVTLTNPNPQNGDQAAVTASIAGQTQPAQATDTATKTWQSAQASSVVLSPRAATNQVNTQHTLTATVQSQFGQTFAQNVTVDFRIFQGPNTGLTQFDTPVNAQGQATFTYSSTAVGTDRILACVETTGQGGGGDNDVCNAGTATGPNNAPAGGGGNEPFDVASKTWQTQPVTTGGVVLDMDADDPNAGPNATPPGGCETSVLNDPARERSASNTINPTQGTDANNFHRICASAFQGAAEGGGRIAGAPITFTITGVGRISAATAQNTCPTNVVPPAGTTVTVAADENGQAFACLFSQQTGRTTVTASSGTPAQSDTGTKDWVVSPSNARFIQLCHGDVAGTTCDTTPATNEPGDDHQLTARVTDRQGNPVANVPVQFRETGPAIFTPQGGSTATVNTDANGLASVIMTSDVEGQSQIVAEILAGAGPGGSRGTGAADDECEAPAGAGGQPAAGNCISQSLTKTWGPVDEFECSDGLDNDDDGRIDFPDDRGCQSDEDDSELPPDERDRFPHDRRISIRFNDGTGARNNSLVVFGRLTAPDGFNECRAQQPVNIQRRVGGRWVTKKSTTTNRRGRYAVEIFDLASRYRAVAPRTEIVDEDLNRVDVCLKAVRAKRHRHRR
jgi:hypothetical protein